MKANDLGGEKPTKNGYLALRENAHRSNPGAWGLRTEGGGKTDRGEKGK